MEGFPLFRISCILCDQPVDLETAKTNDEGDAVHEECYVFEIVLRLKKRLSPPLESAHSRGALRYPAP